MSSDEGTTQRETFTGRVKWFNNRAGYGFITVIDVPSSDHDDKKGTDIFAHHSAIHVKEEQYKYLVQGEYLEFELGEVSSEDYKFQANNIHGIKNGQLQCETRNMNRSTSSRPRQAREGQSRDGERRTRRVQREVQQDVSRRQNNRRRDEGSKEEWVLTRRRR